MAIYKTRLFDMHANVFKVLCNTCSATVFERVNMSAVSLRLPEDVSKRLENLAEMTGRSKTFYMIEAISQHIEDLEDLYLAEQRLIANRSGKSKSIPLEDVMKRYGLEG